MPDMRHMDTKLVRTAGMRTQCDQRDTVPGRLEQAHFAVRGLPVRIDHHAFKAGAPLLLQPVGDSQAGRRLAGDQRQIGLFHITPGKGGGQAACRRAITCQQQQSRCVAVDPVDKPHPVGRIAGQRLQHAVNVTRCSRATLNGEPGRLVDGDPTVPLGDNHLGELGAKPRRCGGRLIDLAWRLAVTKMRRQAQDLASLEPRCRFGSGPVHTDQSGAQHLLDRSLRQTRHGAPQEPVKPASSLGVRHLDKPPVR